MIVNFIVRLVGLCMILYQCFSTSALGNASQTEWRSFCARVEDGQRIDPVFIDLGYIYADYNHSPYMNPVNVPVFMRATSGSVDANITYQFSLRGVDDVQIIYTVNRSHYLIGRYYQSSYHNC